MAAVVVVGTQWGDEGKGKITDWLAEKAEVVVRYQGGSNAGHTVIAGGRKLQLHLVPSGVLSPKTTCVIANGVVLDLKTLLQELAALAAEGTNAKLLISDRAHVIMPYHLAIDEAQERERGNQDLGTTKRGIGPAYTDKVARLGVRVGDLLEEQRLAAALRRILPLKNRELTGVYGLPPYEEQALLREYLAYGLQIKDMVADTSLYVNEALDQGARVLFEGAQGALLDIDHGSYPFVTSSQPVAGGACSGAGVGPTRLDRVIGVVKAYTTRVGQGPFPAELKGSTGEMLRQRGLEYGTTTGRPRRCGLLDLVMLRYANRLNALNSFALTKMDVLDSLPSIGICTAYRYRNSILREFPVEMEVLAECRPEVKELPGWQVATTGARSLEELPLRAKEFVSYLEDTLAVPCSVISVGPDRQETVTVSSIW